MIHLSRHLALDQAHRDYEVGLLETVFPTLFQLVEVNLVPLTFVEQIQANIVSKTLTDIETRFLFVVTNTETRFRLYTELLAIFFRLLINSSMLNFFIVYADINADCVTPGFLFGSSTNSRQYRIKVLLQFNR